MPSTALQLPVRRGRRGGARPRRGLEADLVQEAPGDRGERLRCAAGRESGGSARRTLPPPAAAPGVSSGTDAGEARTSASGRPRARAWATRCSTVTSPMPRAGTLTMRRSETSSRGVGEQLEVGEHVASPRGGRRTRCRPRPRTRMPRAAERLLERARLPVGPVEHRDVVRAGAAGEPLLDAPGDERRLVVLAGGDDELDLRPRPPWRSRASWRARSGSCETTPLAASRTAGTLR